MAFQSQARNATLAEMNITPLVDVMLVLLIIFMVATPMLSRSLWLDLPQVGPPTPPPPPSDTQILRIAADGSVSWNGRALSPVAADAVLRIEGAREETPLLQIEVAPEADYRHMTHWLGRARDAGLTRIAIP